MKWWESDANSVKMIKRSWKVEFFSFWTKMPLKHFPPFHILFLTKSHFINILSILFYFINPSQEYNQTQPNPHGSGYVGLNLWVGQFFLLITIIIKLNRKNISHVPLELTNKIYINSYSNSVINKIYPTELINKTYIN